MESMKSTEKQKRNRVSTMLHICILILVLLWVTLLFYGVAYDRGNTSGCTKAVEATITSEIKSYSDSLLGGVKDVYYEFIMEYSIDGAEYSIVVEDYRKKIPHKGDKLKIWCNPNAPYKYVWNTDIILLGVRLIDIVMHIVVTLIVSMYYDSIKNRKNESENILSN